MNTTLVVVADGARARFLTMAAAQQPEYESGPNLVEVAVLVNPEQEMTGDELFSNLKSGRNRSGNGQAHGYDDHRDSHRDETERRFAKEVIATATQKLGGKGCLTLVADKRMLGFLREVGNGGLHGIEVHEVARDLSKLPATELQQYLAGEGLIPPRKRPKS
ncbi:MAG: host attachment protein [Alphaproteobacteria bacterium CG_4_10_14_0_2_um_filter_63_37]|nr:MAG: hypothetical protein AUJ55_07030 [Proteobacteria bacterium CG1_02_64_396]PJA24850.1 MAG: host attachment protein [Alphaproteobacteria bacterium CG_4_10_14_0_2_um_filter_63_37]